jgi:hypothetical protein
VLCLLEQERVKRPQRKPLQKLMTAKEVGAIFSRDASFVYRLRSARHLKAVWLSDTRFAFALKKSGASSKRVV